MARAYLRVWVDIGCERQVIEALRALEGCVRADITTGEQDIIALIEAGSHQELLDLVIGTVRNISGVERTVTNLVLD